MCMSLSSSSHICVFFFFQAEDGIRDFHVTGVQTCALPICGLSSVALRYANVYGPRQNAHGEAGVVAIFAAKLLDKQQAVINGSGEQTRDSVYVDDVVAANLAASDAEWQGEYNVGTGVETTINELYESLASIAGVDTPAVHAPAKEGEQLRSVLDGRRLRTLAQLPERKLLSDGLKQTFDWFAAE